MRVALTVMVEWWVRVRMSDGESERGEEWEE